MILKRFGISLTRIGPDSLVQAKFFLERIFAGFKSLLKVILGFGGFVWLILVEFFFRQVFFGFKMKVKSNLKMKMQSASLKKSLSRFSLSHNML